MIPLFSMSLLLLSASPGRGDEPRGRPSPVPQQAGIAEPASRGDQSRDERGPSKQTLDNERTGPPGAAENSDRTESR
jgi:hypothetical protein